MITLQESIRRTLDIIDGKTTLVEAADLSSIASDARDRERAQQDLRPGEQAWINSIPTASEQELVRLVGNTNFPTAKRLAKERLDAEFPGWESISNSPRARQAQLRIENTVESKLDRLLQTVRNEFDVEANDLEWSIKTGQDPEVDRDIFNRYIHIRIPHVGSVVLQYKQEERDVPGTWTTQLRDWTPQQGAYIHPIEDETFAWDDFDSAAEKFKDYVGEIADTR